MSFKVELSDLANTQYDKILAYIYHVLENPQAEHFGYCRSEKLRKLGFHKIHLQKHRYLMVYRVKHDKVIVEGMYHELQDYENAIG